MEEWKTYKLGELVKISSGGTPNKAKHAYWGGNIPWISAKVMYGDTISTSDLFITEEGLKNGSKLAEVGSILLLTRGSGLFNHIPVCLVTAPVAYNQDVKCVTTKAHEVVSNQFLYYWLYANKGAIFSILETTGIGAGKIDTQRLLSLDVNLPPRCIQDRISYACSLLFDKIALNTRINHNLS